MDITNSPDEQDVAEIYDDEACGIEDGPPVHPELLAPDGGGPDDVAELIGELVDAEGPLAPEERAMHLTDDPDGP